MPPEEGASHFALLRLNLQSKYADISDFQGLRDIVCSFQPELIFHLAAQSLVRKSYHQALQTIRSNVLGTANLLEAARHCESLRGIVVVSSDKCYANQEKTEGYREEEPLGGYDPYSASKACAEILAGSWRDSFFNLADYGQKHRVLVASARSGNVIGGGDWAEDRIVPDLMRAAISKQALNLRCPRAVLLATCPGSAKRIPAPGTKNAGRRQAGSPGLEFRPKRKGLRKRGENSQDFAKALARNHLHLRSRPKRPARNGAFALELPKGKKTAALETGLEQRREL